MSLASRIIPAVLRLFRFKNRIIRDFRDLPPRKNRALEPGLYPSRLDPQAWEVDGFRLLTLNASDGGAGHIFFLPGGAYLQEANRFHARTARLLADVYGFSISLFGYPLAPEWDFRTSRRVTQQAYLALVEKYPGQVFYLLGDSAGGGLGLGLLQALRDRKIPTRPRKSVLISPWVDLSLSNPASEVLAERDPILPWEGLKYAADKYGGGENLQNPALSPLYGNLAGLGSVLLLCGTCELLYPDCQELAEKLSSAPGSTVEAIFREGLFHDWVIFPLPESKQALERMAGFLRPDRPAG